MPIISRQLFHIPHLQHTKNMQQIYVNKLTVIVKPVIRQNFLIIWNVRLVKKKLSTPRIFLKEKFSKNDKLLF